MRSIVLMLLMVLVVVCDCIAQAQQRDVCVSAVPANIHAGLLTQEIVGLIQVSPTFRAQCERIAAAHHLRIDVELVHTIGVARADTVIRRYEAGALRAKVRIAFGRDYRELIAHEFEHVIEQLDGVDLQAETLRDGAWLVDAQVFETRRASEIGRRVRRECELSNGHAAVVVHDLR